MDSEIKKGLDQLTDRIYDVGEMVAALGDAETYRIKDAKACHEALTQVVDRYNELLSNVPENERFMVERKYERKVMDLRRRADFLPALRVEKPVTPETQGIGVINSPAPRQIASRDRLNLGGLRVGADIDGWCGPCDSIRVHSIVAMVGDRVKQVVCSMCNARHGHRMTPARSKKTGAAARPAITSKKANAKGSRAEEARMALQKELTEATDVRPFAPRARFRAGDIIEHDKYGRGKVENVLRDSILVRFRAGLRPLNTF